MSRARNPLNEFTPNSQGTISKLIVRDELQVPDSFTVPSFTPTDTATTYGLGLVGPLTDLIGPRTFNVPNGRTLTLAAVVNVTAQGGGIANADILIEVYRFNGGPVDVIANMHVVQAMPAGGAAAQMCLVINASVAGDGTPWDYYLRITANNPAPSGVAVYNVINATLTSQIVA